MNVLVLSHMFPTAAKPYKGIFVLEQIRALRKLGVHCTVVAPAPWVPALLRHTTAGRRRPAPPLRTQQDGIEIRHPRMIALPGAALFALSGLFYYLACRREVHQLALEKQVDLIHAHTILPDGFAALLLARELNLPLVCTLHGSDVKLYPQRSRATAAVTSWTLRRISQLIAVSENVALAAHSLEAARHPAIVPNGADAKLFHPESKEAARSRLSLPTGKPIVLFVGNLIPLKGAQVLADAIAGTNRDALLAIVGEGPYRSELEAAIREKGLSAHFAGSRPHEEIPHWLNAADLLVLPSFSEGLPTILAEAMLCRTPVVATAVGGTPEIIRSGETGLLVPPSNAAALGDAIATMLAMDHAQREAMLDRARHFAQQCLTWNVNARQTLAIYESAVEKFATAMNPAGDLVARRAVNQ